MLAMALERYRAHPTDAEFASVYHAIEPWLHRTSRAIVRSYSGLDVRTDGEDVKNEGAIALANATRRYVYLCDCGQAFLSRRTLHDHSIEHHARRGGAELVGIETFAKTSARLAMKRTAHRLVTPYVLQEDIDLGADEKAVARMEFAALLQRAQRHLTIRARVLLAEVLAGHVAASRDLRCLGAARELLVS